MARIIVIFLLALYSSISQAQSGILSKKIAATQLPKGIKFNGKLLELWTWKDNSGENFLLLTKIPDYPVKSAEYNEDARSSDIYAYQYVRNDTGYRMVWKLMDYIKECPFDITLAFLKGSVSITDLDAGWYCRSNYYLQALLPERCVARLYETHYAGRRRQILFAWMDVRPR